MNHQKYNSIFKNQALNYAIEEHTKGHLILECVYSVLNLQEKNIQDFCPSHTVILEYFNIRE